MSQDFDFIPDRLRSGLATMLTAYDYAQDSQSDRWQFAVDLSDLMSIGTTLTDIRWLVRRGFAELARETTIPGDTNRMFRALAPICIMADAGVVLTSAGAKSIRALLRTMSSAGPASAGGQRDEPEAARSRPAIVRPPAPSVIAVTPEWDATHRELRFADQVVKRYRVPARNQAAILDAFQEEGWPEFIDDPIPPDGNQDPKHRLSVTIKSLNRNQLVPLLRFHGNGNGLQVYWEAVAQD
jgi:hypothetical protein